MRNAPCKPRPRFLQQVLSGIGMHPDIPVWRIHLELSENAAIMLILNAGQHPAGIDGWNVSRLF